MDLQSELMLLLGWCARRLHPTSCLRRKLKVAGLADAALQPGRSMPDFELPDATRKIVRSAELRASGPLLIMFYGIVNLRTKPETLVHEE
jgi:hypothetical protein